jgi:hypothetical protein
VIERFLSKVAMCPMSGCWLWLGASDKQGYGRFHRCPGWKDRAHRVAYELFVAFIPEKSVLDHRCRTRCCVNPAHLEPVSDNENKRRGGWFLYSRVG